MKGLHGRRVGEPLSRWGRVSVIEIGFRPHGAHLAQALRRVGVLNGRVTMVRARPRPYNAVQVAPAMTPLCGPALSKATS